MIRRVASVLLGIGVVVCLGWGGIWAFWIYSTIPDAAWMVSVKNVSGIPFVTQKVSYWVTLDCNITDCEAFSFAKWSPISDNGLSALYKIGAPQEWVVRSDNNIRRKWYEFNRSEYGCWCYGNRIDSKGYVYCTAFSFGAL